jgi:hypothetical protein
MISEALKTTGKLNIVLTGADGKVKDSREVNNLVVLVGREFIASRMKDATATVMSHMSVGTDNTTPTAGDTTLAAEVADSRTALTSTTVTSNSVVYVCTFAPGDGTGALVEAGIFNDDEEGDMLCRTIFSVINKGAEDTLTITWTVSINAS